MQNKSCLDKFQVPDVPFKNVKPKTMLKIYNYFYQARKSISIAKINDAIKNFDSLKQLFDAYDEMKKNKESLNFTKATLANLYFEKPIKIDKVFKCINEFGTSNLKKIDKDTKNLIWNSLRDAINEDTDDTNFKAVVSKFLSTENNDGRDLLFAFINMNTDEYFGKFENQLVEICESYKSKEYDPAKKQKVGCVIYCLLCKLSTVLSDNSKNPVKDHNLQVYIEFIIGLLPNSESKFEVLQLYDDQLYDAAKMLKLVLGRFINSYLQPGKHDPVGEQSKNSESIVQVGDRHYDLEKVFGVFKQSYNKQKKQRGYGQNDIIVVKSKLQFYKKILSSSVVEVSNKEKILELAKIYLNKLKENDKVIDHGLRFKTGYISEKEAKKTRVELQISALNIKSNITSHFRENWKTWLSFLLIIPIFFYNFKYKPRYIAEKDNLETLKGELTKEIDKLNSELNKLVKIVDNESLVAPESLIDIVQKFIDDGNKSLLKQHENQNMTIPKLEKIDYKNEDKIDYKDEDEEDDRPDRPFFNQ